MRATGFLLGLVVAGCAVPSPVGVYRMPLQTGPREVRLGTVVAHMESTVLVLWDASTGEEIGRAPTRRRWDGRPEPFELRDEPFPVSVYLRDGVLEDAIERPWPTVPMQPLVAGAAVLEHVTLASEGETALVWLVEGNLFAEQASEQPASDAFAPSLSVLTGFTGSGINLPKDPLTASTWRDAVSTAIPPDAAHEVSCAAPLVGTYRATGPERVSTPAGTFDAVRIVEYLDSCLQGDPASVRVQVLERWFAAGVGPVRMRYQGADGLWHDYLLTETNAAQSGGALWPLETGLHWRFNLHDASGALVRSEKVEVLARQRIEAP
jgi:hypothetical protein